MKVSWYRTHESVESERLIETSTFVYLIDETSGNLFLLSSFSKNRVKTIDQKHLPFGILRPGKKKSPSPTPPFRYRASLTILPIKSLMYLMCLTSSSTGTHFVSAPMAALFALSTTLLSSFKR